jgi:ABC-type polar amino acid transport system ATPase subunit
MPSRGAGPLGIRPGTRSSTSSQSSQGSAFAQRLEGITSGSVVIHGYDLNDRNTKMNLIRTEVGIVFQQFNLFPHMTALQNVTLGPTKVRKLRRSETFTVGMQLLALEKVGQKDADSTILLPHPFPLVFDLNWWV